MGITFDIAVVNRRGAITRPTAEHTCLGTRVMQIAYLGFL